MKRPLTMNKLSNNIHRYVKILIANLIYDHKGLQFASPSFLFIPNLRFYKSGCGVTLI